MLAPLLHALAPMAEEPTPRPPAVVLIVVGLGEFGVSAWSFKVAREKPKGHYPNI